MAGFVVIRVVILSRLEKSSASFVSILTFDPSEKTLIIAVKPGAMSMMFLLFVHSVSRSINVKTPASTRPNDWESAAADFAARCMPFVRPLATYERIFLWVLYGLNS
jgi:hypothetical protein